MVLGGSPADVEALSNLGVRAARGQERQDLGLALGQRRAAPGPRAPGGAEAPQQFGRRVGVAESTQALERPERDTRLSDRRRRHVRRERPGKGEPRARSLQRQFEPREALERRLEVGRGSLSSLSRVHASAGELG